MIDRIDEFPLGRALRRGGRVPPRRRPDAGDRALIARGPQASWRRSATAGRPPPPVISRDRTTRAQRGAVRDHGRGRHRHPRRRRRAGGRGRRAAGAPGRGDRAGRVRRRRDRGLRLHQRNPGRRHRAARLRAADPHLPQPDLLADPVPLGDRRRGQLARARLRAVRAGGDGDRADLVHPDRAGLRRGHRLRAADRGALSRGAAPPGGQARRGGDGDAHGGPARSSRRPPR